MSNKIIDNSKGKELLKIIKEELKKSKEAKFAVGYFFLSGFNLVKDDFPDDIKRKPFLKIIMGNETTYPTKEELVEGFKFKDWFKQKMLEELQREDKQNEIKEKVSELKEMIAKGFIDVKLFDKSKLHAKLYLFLTRPNEKIESPGLAIVGSSNFTATGLTTNKELNALLTSREDVVYLNEWFDKLWEEAIPFNGDLLKIIEWSGILPEIKSKYPKIGSYIDPNTLFRYLVYQWFGDRILKLTKKDILLEFQVVGVLNAAEKINKYDGVIIADSVGLGKSFIASALIEEFINKKHKKWIPKEKKELGILLILPPSVIPQWEELLFLGGATKPFFEGYSFKQIKDQHNDKTYVFFDGNKPLAKIRLLSLGLLQTLKETNPELERMAEIYDLIVIDEAHKYRNNNTNRWKAVRKLQKKKDGFHNKFILLTATPLNNTIVDIFNLVRLFMDDTLQPFRLRGVDFQEMVRKYRELRKKLKNLDDDKLKKELKNLSVRIKNEVLDEIMVLRTRKYIQEKFKDLKINGKALIFRNPIPYAVDYANFLSEKYKNLVDKIKKNIEHINFEHTKLYGSRFVVFEEETIGEQKGEKRYIEISDLFKLLLGKRLESSVFAFETTLRRIYEREKIFYNIFKETKFGITKENIQKVIRKAVEEAKIDKELEELEYDYEVEEDNWLYRTIQTLLKYGKEKLGESEKTEGLLKEGIEVAIEKLEHDLELMEEILQECKKLKEKSLGKLPKQKEDVIDISIWKYKSDPKIEVLFQILGPEKYMSDEIKCENLYKKKVVIFTQYRDTAYYIYHNLVNWAENNPDVGRWLKGNEKLKIALVTGDTNLEAKMHYIKRFAPDANDGWKEVKEFGEVEILVTTDTLSEGVNLQDGQAVINFDLPWNPMQIVQRVGRVNRIGNEKDVVVVNFIPFEELELIVGILKKLKDKIEDISLVVGKETKILMPEEEITIETFGEKIKELAKASTIKLEEMGVSEEFKDILPKGMKEEEVDEYKLINFVQYELGLTPKDFEEVSKLEKPPYYTFVDGDSVITIYRMERGWQEIEKKLIKVERGKIKEVGILTLLDLLRKKKATVIFNDELMTSLNAIKEYLEKRKETFKESMKLAQKGFLAELRKELLRRRQEIKEELKEKWISLLNLLPLLPYWIYSKELKQFLVGEGVIEEENGIVAKDINEVVKKAYKFLKAKNLPLEKGADIGVTYTIFGWYYG